MRGDWVSNKKIIINIRRYFPSKIMVNRSNKKENKPKYFNSFWNEWNTMLQNVFITKPSKYRVRYEIEREREREGER